MCFDLCVKILLIYICLEIDMCWRFYMEVKKLRMFLFFCFIGIFKLFIWIFVGMEMVCELDEEMDFENELLLYIYEGGWNENGEWYGKGKVRFLNGDLYEGEYKNGYCNGYGKYVFRKLKGKLWNVCYMGYYENNKKNG